MIGLLNIAASPARDVSFRDFCEKAYTDFILAVGFLEDWSLMRSDNSPEHTYHLSGNTRRPVPVLGIPFALGSP
jgi:hypothetical protein